MTQMVKNLQELRDLLSEIRQCEMESLVDHLYELTSFELGQSKGFIRQIDEIDNILRNSLKYQEGVE